MVVRPVAASRIFSLLSFDFLQFGGFRDAVENQSELSFVRQSEVQHCNLSFEFRGQAESTSQNDQRFVLGLRFSQHLLHFGDEDGIGVLEEQVEVLQQYHGLLGQGFNGLEGFDGFLGLMHLFRFGFDHSLRD